MKSLLSPIAATIAATILTGALTMFPARAATLDFSFTFVNAIHGGGTVTGIIRGLSEGTGAASSVEVTSNTLGFGLGEYVGSPDRNQWTISGGVITGFDFVGIGITNVLPAVIDASLYFGSEPLLGQSFRAALSPSPYYVFNAGLTLTTADIGLTFERYVAPEPEITPVPLPATGLLLLAGLGGLGLCRRRAA